MFQIAVAIECQAAGKVVTVSLGWGLATFANLPWYRNLFGIVAQGAPGVRRFGLVLFGFFVTAQFVDIDGARKALIGAQIQRRSPPVVKNIRAGVVNGNTKGA